MVVQLTRRRFTADEYHRMAEAGLLTEDDRVELINGEIIEMAPIGSRHASGVRRLIFLLSQRFAGRAMVDVQNPLQLGRHSEPQPDATLLRHRADFYRGVHPSPEDVLLVIEVGDTTAVYDREAKLPLYAAYGISEAWRVDLEGGHLEVHRTPRPEGYSEVHILRRGHAIAPQAFQDVEFSVDELLGDA